MPERNGRRKEHSNKLRAEALAAFEKGQYTAAIDKWHEILDNGTTEGNDFMNLGLCYLYTKQYLKAVKYAKEAEKIDDTELKYKCCLAHSYLLNGDVDLAKEIYVKYKSQNIDESHSWYESVKSSFDHFKSKGIECAEFQNVLDSIKP